MMIRTVLATLLVFCLGVFGALAIPKFDITTPLFVTIIIVSLSPIVFLILTERLSEIAGAVILFTVALILLYHNALATEFLFGRDIAFEFYHAKEILRDQSFSFEMGINQKMNALLTVTLLASIIAEITGTSLTWTYKVAYPILFALIPVLIFRAIRYRHNVFVSYAASLLFISYFFYFTTGLENIKQSMSILFIAILGLTLARQSYDISLQLLAVIGLVLSHYGIPYIVLFAYLTSRVIVRVISFIDHNRATEDQRLSLVIGLLIGIGMVFWHSFAAGGEGFRSFVILGYRIAESISGPFGDVAKSGAYYATSSQAIPSVSYEVMRYLYLISQGLIVIGFLRSTIRLYHQEADITISQYSFAGVMFTLLGISFIVPTLLGGFSLGLTRMYQISLVFIAVFFPIGAIQIGRWSRVESSTVRRALAVFLILLLLFNTRAVMEARNQIGEYDTDYAASLSLSQTRIADGQASDQEAAGYYRTANPAVDVRSARWIEKYTPRESEVISDNTMLLILYGHRSPERVDNSHTNPPALQSSTDKYLFLRRVNTQYDIFIGDRTDMEMNSIRDSVTDDDLVYTTNSTKLFK